MIPSSTAALSRARTVARISRTVFRESPAWSFSGQEGLDSTALEQLEPGPPDGRQEVEPEDVGPAWGGVRWTPGKEAARRAWVPALTHVSDVRPRAALAWAALALPGRPAAR